MDEQFKNGVKFITMVRIDIDTKILSLYMHEHGRDCTCFSGERILNTGWRICEDCGAKVIGGSCFKRCEECAIKAYLKDIGNYGERGELR